MCDKALNTILKPATDSSTKSSSDTVLKYCGTNFQCDRFVWHNFLDSDKKRKKPYDFIDLSGVRLALGKPALS